MRMMSLKFVAEFRRSYWLSNVRVARIYEAPASLVIGKTAKKATM